MLDHYWKFIHKKTHKIDSYVYGKKTSFLDERKYSPSKDVVPFFSLD